MPLNPQRFPSGISGRIGDQLTQIQLQTTIKTAQHRAVLHNSVAMACSGAAVSVVYNGAALDVGNKKKLRDNCIAQSDSTVFSLMHSYGHTMY